MLDAVGNVTVKVVVDVLSEPKSSTQMAGSPLPDLYINAPRAVKLAGTVGSSKVM